MTENLIGRQLANYQIEKHIGSGGMADVYFGRDMKSHRPVAIKVIAPHYRDDEEFVLRFMSAARSMAAWQHENIIPVYTIGEDSNLNFFIMEFIEGQSLADILSSHFNDETLIPTEQVIRIGSNVAMALDYAHTQGVLHRDIKPANILISNDDRVVVTDFGLAPFTDLRFNGETLGTTHYLPPELADSSTEALPQSDLYSFGVMLFEMLTGVLPFDDPSPAELLMQHKNQSPPSPCIFNPGLSKEVERVLFKILHKSPKNRYQTGRALMKDLEEALQTPPGEKSSTSTQPLPGNTGPHSQERENQDNAAGPLKPSPDRLGLAARFRPYLWLAGTIIVLSILLLSLWALTTKTNQAIFSTAPTETPWPTLAETTPISTNSGQPAVIQSPTKDDKPPSPAAKTPTLTALPTHTSTPAPTAFKRAERTEDLMPMILVPAGKFGMGASDDDPNAEIDEMPQHEVFLDSFYIDQFEVSVAQYAGFLNTLKKHWGSACLASACARTQTETDQSHLQWDGIGNYHAEAGFENHPINNITWYGAQAYCEWVGARLPTEAEWEYAARGWDGRLYPWGNISPNQTLAVFDQEDYESLQPVNSLPEGASFFGVYHMAGNVIEWVADTYLENYYALFGTFNRNPVGPPGQYRSYHVLRGGSWEDPAPELRASTRRGAEPILFDLFGYDVGFRCVRSTGASSSPP